MTARFSDPARVLYVHNSADIYGASRSLLRLLPAVAQAGVVPTVLLPEEGPLRNRITALGVETVVDRTLAIVTRQEFGSPRGLLKFSFRLPQSVLRLRRLIKSREIDLVHTNTGVIPAAGPAARLAGVPHVWHVRDSFLEFRGLWPVYRRYIRAFSNRIIAVSRPIADQFPAESKVVVIHNGISLTEFPEVSPIELEAFRQRHRLSGRAVVGCVGRIKFVRKGQETLVQAAAQLKQAGIFARYLIVGAPAPGNEEHLTRLHALIQDSGLSEDFIFTGELADVKTAYAAMDVVVLPSGQPEPFGGVVLEAMGMGRPVVATAIGGSVEQVADGETGYLFPPADAKQLAEKLALLLRDETVRKRFGQAGRERLASCFSFERMIEKFLDIYQSVLAR